MSYRKKMSKRGSRRQFSRGNRLNKRNLNSGGMAMRGGVRL